MFILKKLFQLRDHASTEDSEKPFLEHLEDLRKTITKIVLTLVISMIACFTFQDRLMKVLQKPVNEVTRIHQEKQIPKSDDLSLKLDNETWENAKRLERAAAPLAPEDREVMYRFQDAQLVTHAKVVALLRSSLAVPEDKREAYISSIKSPSDGFDVQKQIRALIATKANPELDTKAGTMSTLKPTESFMLSMKLAFFAGIVVAFPLLLYFLLQFILPGLHGHERRVMWPALAIGFGLFIGGGLFAYYLVLPKTLLFFADWGNDMGISNDWRIGEYISFATQFTLLFGAAFELPVVVMVAVKLGLLGYQTMKKTRSYAIVGIFIIAALLTPTPDMMTQLLMACPMIILYEICIWLAWWDEKKQAKQEAEESRQRMERLLAQHENLDPYANEGAEDEAHGDHHNHDHFHHSHDEPSHEELAGNHDEPPVDYDPDLLPPPTTREEPRGD